MENRCLMNSGNDPNQKFMDEVTKALKRARSSGKFSLDPVRNKPIDAEKLGKALLAAFEKQAK